MSKWAQHSSSLSSDLVPSSSFVFTSSRYAKARTRSSSMPKHPILSDSHRSEHSIGALSMKKTARDVIPGFIPLSKSKSEDIASLSKTRVKGLTQSLLSSSTLPSPATTAPMPPTRTAASPDSSPIRDASPTFCMSYSNDFRPRLRTTSSEAALRDLSLNSPSLSQEQHRHHRTASITEVLTSLGPDTHSHSDTAHFGAQEGVGTTLMYPPLQNRVTDTPNAISPSLPPVPERNASTRVHSFVAMVMAMAVPVTFGANELSEAGVEAAQNEDEGSVDAEMLPSRERTSTAGSRSGTRSKSSSLSTDGSESAPSMSTDGTAVDSQSSSEEDDSGANDKTDEWSSSSADESEIRAEHNRTTTWRPVAADIIVDGRADSELREDDAIGNITAKPPPSRRRMSTSRPTSIAGLSSIPAPIRDVITDESSSVLASSAAYEPTNMP